jgi:alkyldihydroxyacetonephosphate synthase
MNKKSRFKPNWIEQAAAPDSYRSLIKWGDLQGFKHPNSGMYRLVKETFGMSDEDFVHPQRTGMEAFDAVILTGLNAAQLEALGQIVGPENVFTGTYERTCASYGKGTIDALRLRQHIIENLPGAVVAPRSTRDVQALMQYCNEQHLPMYVHGGGSTVTRGMEAVQGGICLDLSRHMNQLIRFSETNQTVTVQAGMMGPALEEKLNQAPEKLKARQRYTCGHFPQSFMHSSVGGWVVTRGAGQNSTYYGKIEDMVLAQEYVTLQGILQTPGYPRSATGPDFDQLMMGSEGCFGVLTSVTLRVLARKYSALQLFVPQLGGCAQRCPRGNARRVWPTFCFPALRPGGDGCCHAHVSYPWHTRRYSPESSSIRAHAALLVAGVGRWEWYIQPDGGREN